MQSVTYSTIAPSEISGFLADVAQLFSTIERQLYRDLEQGKSYLLKKPGVTRCENLGQT